MKGDTLPTRVLSPESAARLSAFLGHDQNDVIRGLQKDYGLSFAEALRIVTYEYTLRREIDEQDAIDAEHEED